MKVPIRSRHFRVASQLLFLAAFCFLFWALAWEQLPGKTASLLLALDPLTAVGTALADWSISHWVWVGVLVLVATTVLGRFFCGWICPLGTLQHLVSWIAGPERRKLPKINRYRKWFSIKYLVLTVLLTWAALAHLGRHFAAIR